MARGGPEATPPAQGDDRWLELLVVGLHYAPEPSGNAPYTTGLARGLARSGHAVRVITGYPHYPQWRIYDGYTGRRRTERDAGVSLVRLRPWVPRHQGLPQRTVMESWFGLRAALERWGRPATVVLVSPALFATGIAMLGARLRRRPVVVWVQDIYSLGVAETGHSPWLARVIARLESTVLRSATAVVVIHDRFERVVVDRLGVSPERVTVVRNWSHVPVSPDIDREQVRLSLGWQPDDVVVLHAGNMGAKQGLENVVEAAAVAARSGSSVRFVLLGDGTRRSSLEALSDGQHLTFMDPLPDEEYLRVMSAADVLLINERPGMSEMSVPSKLTSYLSTGLPVVAATDGASITAEELARAGAGVRVDAGDPRALVEAAEELGLDVVRARAYGSAGKTFRADHLDEKTAVAKFEGVLRRSSRQPSPPRRRAFGSGRLGPQRQEI